MATTTQNGLHEAIEELKREFLDGIPTPPRPMAPFRWAGGKGNLVRWIIQYVPMAGKIRGSKLQGTGAAKAHVPRTETLYLNFAPPGLCADLFGTG